MLTTTLLPDRLDLLKAMIHFSIASTFVIFSWWSGALFWWRRRFQGELLLILMRWGISGSSPPLSSFELLFLVITVKFFRHRTGLRSFIPSKVDIEKPEFESEAFRYPQFICFSSPLVLLIKWHFLLFIRVYIFRNLEVRENLRVTDVQLPVSFNADASCS